MNLRQTGRISLLSVALNIITCFSWGVSLKISWTSRLMSAGRKKNSFKNTSIALVNCFYSVYKVEPFFKLFFKKFAPPTHPAAPAFYHTHQAQSV